MFKRLAIFGLIFIAGFFVYFSIQNFDSFPFNLLKANIPQTSEESFEEEESELAVEETISFKEPQVQQEVFIKRDISKALEEIQEELDDISEKIDVLSQEVAVLVGIEQEVKGAEDVVEEEPQEELEEEEKIEEEKLKEEELEKELEEKKLEQETKKEVEQKFCEKITGDYPKRNKVIINEMAWMGGPNSANDEWLELKNISGADVDLSSWQLLNGDGKIKIIFGSGDRVSGNGFFLLERTNDETLPNISSDKIYTGALGNEGEIIFLFSENCQLEDEILADSGWQVGDNSSKRTMEKPPTNDWWGVNWQTSADIGGTPKRENSGGFIPPVAGGGGIVILPPSPPSYPKLLISEVQISNKEDFVELYNPNNQDVDLTDWYLQRKTKTAQDFSSYAPQNLFAGKIISAKDYFLIANASSSFSADATTTYPLTEDNTLVLKNPNREIVDTATTASPMAGESLGRKWSTSTENYADTDNNQNDFEIQSPTPKAQNQSPALQEPEKPLTQPILEVSTTTLIFKTEEGENHGSHFLTIGNSGNAELNWSSSVIYEPILADWLLINPATGTVPSFSSSTIEVFADISGLTTGNYSATTTIESNNANNSPQIIATELTIFPKTVKTVIINEIAWMGSASSSWDEWIELYNNTGFPVDLAGWKIKKGDEIFITFSTSTAATTTISDFYLLERDEKATDITADFVYGGERMNNGGEKLELRDAEDNLIDLVDCSVGWFAGLSSPDYFPMERINSDTIGSDSDNWKTSQETGGTPKAKNSVSF